MGHIWLKEHKREFLKLLIWTSLDIKNTQDKYDQ